MAPNRNRNSGRSHWYEEPVKRAFAILTGFIAVAGIGYGFAAWQKDLEFKLKEIQLNQDCSEKVQLEINKSKEEKQAYENKKVENLEAVVNNLQNTLNGRR